MSESHANTGWASDSPTPAQLKEFFGQIERGRITKAGLQAFLRGASDDIPAQLRSWCEFYKKYLGIDLDLRGMRIPDCAPGFDQLLVVKKGLTLNIVYHICTKHFPCFAYAADLDKEIPENDRKPSRVYALWMQVYDQVEADKEKQTLSANQMREQEIVGPTLLERMLFELKVWDETGGQHPDINNQTICSSSRCHDGGVPLAGWDNGVFRILWGNPNDSSIHLRSSSVVS